MLQLVLVALYLSSLLDAGSSTVHKLTAKRHFLSAESAIRRQSRFEEIDRKHGVVASPAATHQRDAGSIFANESSYVFVGSITVGTPPQRLVVEIDPFYATDLAVIGQDADLSHVKYYLPGKHVFNSGASSTYSNISGNFSDLETGAGYLGYDVVGFDKLSTNMTFGILDMITWTINFDPVDGVLGLMDRASTNNITNALTQMVSGLDKPVISYAQNETRHGSGWAQITLGAEDTDHCQPYWIYVLRTFSRPSDTHYYKFHLSSASTKNSTGSTITQPLNTTALISHWTATISVPPKLFDLFTNASGAVFNRTMGFYVVDCDLSKAANVTLNIGGSGDRADTTTRKLIVTPAEYIRFYKRYKVCWLAVHRAPKDESELILGGQFLNYHCFSYNVNKRVIAFADAKKKIK